MHLASGSIVVTGIELILIKCLLVMAQLWWLIVSLLLQSISNRFYNFGCRCNKAVFSAG